MIEGALLVRWSAARQVAAELDWPKRQLPAAEIGVAEYYDGLRRRGEVETAVTFLAAALPRHESIGWAAHVLDRAARGVPDLGDEERSALARVLDWVADPSEIARRAAEAAGEAVDEDAPERMLTGAVFLSGGSISTSEFAPVGPPPGASGQLAAAAIILAAHRSGDAPGLFAAALDLGEAVAERGLAALPKRLVPASDPASQTAEPILPHITR